MTMPAVTRVVAIRHGETAWNAEQRLQRAARAGKHVIRAERGEDDEINIGRLEIGSLQGNLGGFVAKIRDADLAIDEMSLQDAGALTNPLIAGGHELRHLLIRHNFFGNVMSGADNTTAFHIPPSSPLIFCRLVS